MRRAFAFDADGVPFALLLDRGTPTVRARDVPIGAAASVTPGITLAGTIVRCVSRRAVATESHWRRARFTAMLCCVKVVVNS